MKALVVVAATFVTFAALARPAPAMRPVARPVARTAAGPVRGVEQAGVAAYLGIPYARPPVGELRWRDPRPVAPWRSMRDASKAAASCYQSAPAPFGPYTAEFLIEPPISEDCLYLNVWSPKTGAHKLPVYFFIHGGGFSSGSGSIPIYNGADLAARGGVVVVTINYRLGVFGFLAHPALTAEAREGKTSGNYGLLDIVAALKWVRANIAAFGGDPRNVTIAGQSAGAAAVDDLLLSPPAQGLFQRAVAESGSLLGGLSSLELKEAEQNGLAFAAKVGAADLAALRRMPADKLMAASEFRMPPPGEKPAGPAIRFAPNSDGVVIVGSAGNPRSKPVSDVPLLTGFNAGEGSLFPFQKSVAAFEEYVRGRFGSSADRVLAVYPHADNEQAAASQAVLARDSYTVSLVVWAQLRAQAGGRTYTYLYDHAYPEAGGIGFGAFHTAEVPYVFGALGLGQRRFTDDDRAISRQLQDHWLAFMRTGNPSTPSTEWPAANAASSSVMGLGDTHNSRLAASTQERYDVLHEFYAAGGKTSLF